MTTNSHEIKAMLESKREEVLARMRRLDDITVERAPDPVDELEMLTERESAITLLERDSQLLRASALAKTDPVVLLRNDPASALSRCPYSSEK